MGLKKKLKKLSKRVSKLEEEHDDLEDRVDMLEDKVDKPKHRDESFIERAKLGKNTALIDEK